MNNPVLEEHLDNLRFCDDVAKWVGIDVIHAFNTKINTISAVDIWDTKKYMSGIKGAPCTVELKKEARYQFEERNKIDWHVLGFTADEKPRSDRFIRGERKNTLPVLIDENITKDDCFKILNDAGIKLPDIYHLGYPNANCIGCVKATSPTYWNHVRKMHPNIFKQRADQSRRIGCKLTRYKGKRLFLDELPIDAKGRPMKNLKSVECGIFCDTN